MSEEGRAAADWRTRYMATVASDVSERDGLGWEFSDFQQADVWAVFREDGGPFPVFSASRGSAEIPPADQLLAMTREAVADLLSAADVLDDVGWLTNNIASALLFASIEVVAWEGEEWAVELGPAGEALEWAGTDDPRIPFAWIRAHTHDRDLMVSIYQDDANFGLNFVPTVEFELPTGAEGGLRPRSDVPLVTGTVRAVEVVCDTVVEGSSAPGLVTEVLLHGEHDSTLLIAAEAYSRDEWHLYDESVVVVRDPGKADDLPWVPERLSWRPTEGRAWTT